MTIGAKWWNSLIEEVITEWTGRDGLINFVGDTLDGDGYLATQEPVTVKQLLGLSEEQAYEVIKEEIAKQQVIDPNTGDAKLPGDLMRLVTDYISARNDALEEGAQY